MSPCVTLNKIITYKWFRENTYKLDDDSSYDTKNKMQAWKRLTRKGKIPLGLVYMEKKPSYESLVLPDQKKPLVFNDGSRRLEVRKNHEKISMIQNNYE